MNVLAFETAADPGSVALLCEDQVTLAYCPAGEANSASLLPLAQALMRDAGVDFAQLDGVAFGAGPGSFTGLRVACGIAQGIAVARDLPLLAVGTLEAMAAAAGGEKLIVVLDARMGEVYFGLFEGGILKGGLGVCAPEAIPLPDSKAWVACGNGLDAYPVLRERLAPYVVSWQPDLMPSADALVRLAAVRFARGERIDPAEAVPLYVRDKVAKTVAERLAEGGRA